MPDDPAFPSGREVMFTTILIAVGALSVVVLVVHEIRSWRKPGQHISQNASMNDDHVNKAHLTQDLNVHRGDFGDGRF